MTSSIRAPSTSSSTIAADLPPISAKTCFAASSVCASRAIWQPVRTEPVKPTTLTSGWAVSAAPQLLPTPVTRLITPAGKSISAAIWARASAVSGVNSEGLSTMQQPAASAGASLRMTLTSGQLKGRMQAATPAAS